MNAEKLFATSDLIFSYRSWPFAICLPTDFIYLFLRHVVVSASCEHFKNENTVNYYREVEVLQMARQIFRYLFDFASYIILTGLEVPKSSKEIESFKPNNRKTKSLFSISTLNNISHGFIHFINDHCTAEPTVRRQDEKRRRKNNTARSWSDN